MIKGYRVFRRKSLMSFNGIKGVKCEYSFVYLVNTQLNALFFCLVSRMYGDRINQCLPFVERELVLYNQRANLYCRSLLQ